MGFILVWDIGTWVWRITRRIARAVAPFIHRRMRGRVFESLNNFIYLKSVFDVSVFPRRSRVVSDVDKEKQAKKIIKTSAIRKIASERGEETQDPPLSGGPCDHNLLSMDVSPVLLVITYVLLLSFSKRCSARTHTRLRLTQKNANKWIYRIIIIIRLCNCVPPVSVVAVYSIVSGYAKLIFLWFSRTVSQK